MAPNVLVIVLDAARRDAVEPYGAAPGSTPAIAQLARRGHALPHAYANSSWTLPSHASMFSGLLPRTLGLTQPPDGSAHSVAPAVASVEDRWLPAVLRGAGYRTHGFSTNLWVSASTGFDLGFDSFSYFTSGREERINQLLSAGIRGKLAWAREGLRAKSDDGATAAGAALRTAIDAHDGRPAFWFVNLVECHAPYLPPRPFNDLGARARVRAALEAQRHLNFLAICLHVAGRHHVPEPALERMHRLYKLAISYMDSWLAEILAALERKRILDDTLVIVTSDHGENFGEGGLIVHGFSLDERLIRVPFVVAGPGAEPVDRPFTLADLPAYVARAAGLDHHPWDGGGGVAVAQYDAMGLAGDARVQEFARTWQLDEAAISRLMPTLTAATDGRLKLVLRNGAEERYDLEQDPLEQHPVALDDDAFRVLRAAATAQAAPPMRPPTSVAPPASPTDEEVEALERQMKLLGYM